MKKYALILAAALALSAPMRADQDPRVQGDFRNAGLGWSVFELLSVGQRAAKLFPADKSQCAALGVELLAIGCLAAAKSQDPDALRGLTGAAVGGFAGLIVHF